MDCPKCKSALKPTTYEDVRVLQCNYCRGYLVAKRKLRLIKVSRDVSSVQLEHEAKHQAHEDTSDRIKCPKCKVERMEKQLVKVSEEDHFQLDECSTCESVWLDGGELARLQIEYEKSALAIEAYALQRRVGQRTTQQKEELEKDIARLPNDQSAFKLASVDLAIVFGVVISLVLAAIFWFLGNDAVASVSSLVTTALVVWVILTRIDDYLNENKYMRFVLAGVAVALEIGFLTTLFVVN